MFVTNQNLSIEVQATPASKNYPEEAQPAASAGGVCSIDYAFVEQLRKRQLGSPMQNSGSTDN